ncbi:MAG TPA: hypothetical protein VII46_08125 [Acidimicrobiales bacterium]
MGERPEPEGALGPSGQGSVVLDIGGDRGAAIIFAPDRMAGEELEIRPVGQAWEGVHTAVRRRDLDSAVRYAGVFGSLPAGQYHLRVRGRASADPCPAPTVGLVVHGGRVTELTWPPTGTSSVPQAPVPPLRVNPS